MAKLLYNEVQMIKGNLLWTVLLLLPAVALPGMLAYQVITGELVGDHPMSNLSLAIFSICYLIPIVLAFPYVKLTTLLDEEKIVYGWNVPTNDLNEILIADIAEWSVIKYRFVGYGYRLSFLYGKVYNLAGNRGLQIITKEGKKILIGTSRPEELEAVLIQIRLKP